MLVHVHIPKNGGSSIDAWAASHHLQLKTRHTSDRYPVRCNSTEHRKSHGRHGGESVGNGHCLNQFEVAARAPSWVKQLRPLPHAVGDASWSNWSTLPHVRPWDALVARKMTSSCNVSHLPDRTRKLVLHHYAEDVALHAQYCARAKEEGGRFRTVVT